MELWIRSQDKEILVLAKGFELHHLRSDGCCQIFAVWQNNYQCVGIYNSKKRALEVLNEIQQQLVNKYYLTPKEKLTCTDMQKLMNIDRFNNRIDVVSTLEKMELNPLNNNVYVYEMPKE